MGQSGQGNLRWIPTQVPSLYATVWSFPRRRRFRFSASSIILATIARSASLKAASSVSPVTTAPMDGTVATNWSPVCCISILCVVLTSCSISSLKCTTHLYAIRDRAKSLVFDAYPRNLFQVRSHHNTDRFRHTGGLPHRIEELHPHHRLVLTEID